MQLMQLYDVYIHHQIPQDYLKYRNFFQDSKADSNTNFQKSLEFLERQRMYKV